MINNIIKFIKYLKCKLPLNGDWIYVTKNYNAKTDKLIDLSKKFEKSEDFYNQLKTNDIHNLEFIYNWATNYYKSTLNRAENVRDKAKAILNSSSIMGSILVALSTLALTINKITNKYLFVLELIFMFMIILNFIRALINSVSVMRREITIDIPATIIADFGNNKGKKLKDIYKTLSSELIANANQTQEFVRKRVNQLIITQTSFQYGLIYFLFFIIIHVFSSNFFLIEKKDILSKHLNEQNDLLRIMNKSYQTNININKNLLESINKNFKKYIEQY